MSTTDTAKEKLGQASGQAQQKTQELRGQAGSRVREQVDTRSTQAGEQVTSIAQAVRTTSDQLRSQGKERPAKLAEHAADRAERLGGYLQESDGERILGDVENFARRQPWLIAAAFAALGFLAARFVKTSSGGDGQQAGEGYAVAAWDQPPPVEEAPVPGALEATPPLAEPSAPPATGPLTGRPGSPS